MRSMNVSAAARPSINEARDSWVTRRESLGQNRKWGLWAIASAHFVAVSTSGSA